MNILHMKYAVEVARAGSLNKAAEKLYVAQPNLSRCIKELETELGITIFDRTSSGMRLTGDGEEFIKQAGRILRQIDGVERFYRDRQHQKKIFYISVPRSAQYITDAFSRFCRAISDTPAEVSCREMTVAETIKNVANGEHHLGIIRYDPGYDTVMKDKLDDKGLVYETVAQFRYVLVMSLENPLAQKRTIGGSDLAGYTEIMSGDPCSPDPIDEPKKRAGFSDDVKSRIYLSDRYSRVELLSDDPNTFMWTPPLPHKLFERFSLVQRECTDSTRLCKDVLIRKKDRPTTELDRIFINELTESRRRWIK